MNKSIQRIKKIVSVYDRYSRYISAVSFLFGFVIDFMATRRIDAMTDNYILLGYVFLAGLLIVLYYMCVHERIRIKWIAGNINLIRAGIDFFIGGLFSSHVIFYFKSSAGFKSVVFIVILLALLIINQFFRKQTSRLYLRMGMYSLASFSFFVFFLPVLTREMNRTSFICGVLISFVFTLIITTVVLISIKKPAEKPFFKMTGMIVIIYGTMCVFYFMNWIPPVPLALKHAGIYHHVSKSDFFYTLTYEQKSEWNVWQTSDVVYNYQPGDTVFCFASVFAPTAMKKTIYHRWKYFDPKQGEWIFVERLSYDLMGGRDGGYRGFSYKTSIIEGKWKIDIVTGEEVLIGSVEFTVNVTAAPEQRKMKTILR